jgi:hypothetical protein
MTASSVDAPMTGGVDVFLTAPITFEVTDDVVHCPMVYATVGGVTAKFILDTGASDHVFTMEFARSAKLKSEPGEPGFDHAGVEVPSFTLGDVAAEFAGMTLELKGAFAIEGPTPFEDWGIGGFLSPHSLHPGAWVVIDLVAAELIVATAESPPMSAWLKRRHPSMDLLLLERVAGETVAVMGAIEPFATVVTMLNTGSSGTEFDVAAVPGLRGAPAEASGFGLSGSGIDGEEVSGQSLRLGGRLFPLSVLLIREEMPHPPGLVGMDVLAGTVLAVGSLPGQPVLWLVEHR